MAIDLDVICRVDALVAVDRGKLERVTESLNPRRYLSGPGLLRVRSHFDDLSAQLWRQEFDILVPVPVSAGVL